MLARRAAFALASILAAALTVAGCGSGAPTPTEIAASPGSSHVGASGSVATFNGDAGASEGPCPVGGSRSCYVSSALGACRSGAQRCERAVQGELFSATWGPCVSLVAPAPERCNGVDDDCDGVVDEGCTPGPLVEAGPPSDGSAPADAAPPSDAGPPPPPADAGPPPPPPSPCSETCTGKAILIDQTAKYGLWVQVVLCSSSRYDIRLGPTAQGPFSKIGDLQNGGQDHCELVNPAFSLGNEAVITSGNCPTCDLEYGGRAHLRPDIFGTTLYTRYYFGQSFQFTSNVPRDALNADVACWYECGVSF